jgi:hypothetical protein
MGLLTIGAWFLTSPVGRAVALAVAAFIALGLYTTSVQEKAAQHTVEKLHKQEIKRLGHAKRAVDRARRVNADERRLRDDDDGFRRAD